MAKKYYAVFSDSINKVFYDEWKNVQPIVQGVSNIKFKSFKTKEDAQSWLATFDQTSDQEKDDSRLVAYVDGSNLTGYTGYGSGAVILYNNEILDELSFMGNDERFLQYKQVPGEVFATIKAAQWAVDRGYNDLTVYYDYNGISDWATETWKTTSDIAKLYVTELDALSSRLNITFKKVPAHTGVIYNERADELAKQALINGASLISERKSQRNSETKADGSLTIRDVRRDEIQQIVKQMQENLDGIELQTNLNAGSAISHLSLGKDKVTVTLYSSGTLRVQGSPSKLMEVSVHYFLQLVTDSDELLEQLNNVNRTLIKENTIDKKIKHYLPKYVKTDENTDLAIRSIMYDLQILDSGMVAPEYSARLFSVLKVLERYMHHGLKKGSVPTTDKRGRTSFGNSFQRATDGTWQVPSKYLSNFDGQTGLVQLMGEMYGLYHDQRHRLFHWSENDDDTILITDKETARDNISDALDLIKRFYDLVC